MRGKADSGQSLALSLATGSASYTNRTGWLTNFSFLDTEERTYDFYAEATFASGVTLCLHWTGTGSGYFAINRPILVNMTKLGLS